MTFEEILVKVGFNEDVAFRLARNPYFWRKYKNRTSEELSARIFWISKLYDTTEEKVREAIIRNPAFMAKKHSRVLRDLERIGKLVGVSSTRVKELVVEHPSFASYSVGKYLAVIDVFRQAAKETGCVPNDILVDWWARHYTERAFVPNTKDLRITKAERHGMHREDPDLLISLRRHLARGNLARLRTTA